MYSSTSACPNKHCNNSTNLHSSTQVSCVSGAQLASYATFLAHPEQAPLSIVLVALSTAMGVVVTPLLALALLGARLPIDAVSMAVSIFQIVLAPVTAGAACRRRFVL